VRRIWPAKKWKSAKKRKIRAITPFKVIQGHRGRYQSKARMRLPIRLIGKRVVDFLLVIIELFSLRSEALRAKIDRQSAILLQRGQFDPKFQIEGDVPTNHFCKDS